MAIGVTYEIDPQPGVMNGTWWYVARDCGRVADGVFPGVSEKSRADALTLAKTVAHAIGSLYGESVGPMPVDPPPAPVVLIACGKGKGRRACKALDLYNGTHYNLRRKWCREVKGVEPSGILSAKHGLLRPDAIVGPYDATMDEKSADERRDWSREVLLEVLRRWPANTEITVLAGTPYVDGWMGEATRMSRPIVHRKFSGIGYERKALASEIAEATDGPSKQTGLFI